MGHLFPSYALFNKSVFPKHFEPRHTKIKPEISRHTCQFAFIFLSSNIALLALDELNLQLNLQLNLNKNLKFGMFVVLRHFSRHSKFFWRHTVWGTL
jgi:hypothetical protein